MKPAPAVAALVLGVALAVGADARPASAATCPELPAPDPTFPVLYAAAAVDSDAWFGIAGLCADVPVVATELANPDAMTVAVLADGSPDAGITLSPPAGFTGESVVRVELAVGALSEVYEVSAFFGVLPTMSWPSPPALVPLDVDGWADIPLPGWSVPTTPVTVCHAGFTVVPAGTVAHFGFPSPGGDIARLWLVPRPSGTVQAGIDVECRSRYGSAGTHSYLLTLGDPPAPSGGSSGGARLADTGGTAPPLPLVLGAVGAIAAGALLLARSRGIRSAPGTPSGPRDAPR